jgi:hypothetical protein
MREIVFRPGARARKHPRERVPQCSAAVLESGRAEGAGADAPVKNPAIRRQDRITRRHGAGT